MLWVMLQKQCGNCFSGNLWFKVLHIKCILLFIKSLCGLGGKIAMFQQYRCVCVGLFQGCGAKAAAFLVTEKASCVGNLIYVYIYVRHCHLQMFGTITFHRACRVIRQN